VGDRRPRRRGCGEGQRRQRTARPRACSLEDAVADDHLRGRRRRRRHGSGGVRLRARGLRGRSGLMSETIWVIGAAMTKFGRYPEKDVVDLASDAALDAMADAGATIGDMNVMAVGSLLEM